MIGHVVSSMGKDKIRYLVCQHGRWKWKPTMTMRTAGFTQINFGRELTNADKAQALSLNSAWDRHRRGLPPETPVIVPRYPEGSIGAAYLRALALRETERRSKGIVWSSEQRSRDDWPRAWRWIEPLFGDCDPKTVTPEHLIGDPANPRKIGLRPMIVEKISEAEAHRVIKVWRALWKKMARFGMCALEQDPSLLFANSSPSPRQYVWRNGEAVRLVKCAWRQGYHGLAALLAVAWDSQLSPVDARSLTGNQWRRDPVGTWFELDRAKTGRPAVATLSRRTQRLLAAYLGQMPVEPIGFTPIFRNRSGSAYSKDKLGDDFRAVRKTLFGNEEKRQLADFRRSGSVEALAGSIEPEKLSSKMANSLSTSNRLHKTYGPVQLASVRDADEARQKGRAKLRAVQLSGERKPDKSSRIPTGKFPNQDQFSAKPLKTMARATGLEPAASGVTGRRSNQLSYARRERTRTTGGASEWVGDTRGTVDSQGQRYRSRDLSWRRAQSAPGTC